MKRNILITLVLISTLMFLGCGKKEVVETKSMEDIYREEGIPVEVQTIEKSDLVKTRTFFTTMEGVREITQISKVSDQVERIHYKIGDYVEKDTVVLSFPNDTAMAQYRQTKSQYDDALQTVNRMRSVLEEGGVSEQEVNQLETQVDVLRATLDMATDMVEVKAPISGVITEIFVNESDRVFPDDNLFTISELSRLKAEVWVNEDDISLVKKGLRAKAEWRGNTINGSVTAVALNMNPSHKAFRTEIEFDNAGYKIKGGVTTDVSLTLSSKKNIIALDRVYILGTGDNVTTWVDNNGTAEKRTLELGIVNDLKVEVLKGLKAGDMLITKGYNRVKEGSKLKVLN